MTHVFGALLLQIVAASEKATAEKMTIRCRVDNAHGQNAAVGAAAAAAAPPIQEDDTISVGTTEKNNPAP